AVGLASLALFALDRGHALLDFSRFHFGTLPAGDYPRLRLTFLNANLACNYLTVSLMLLFAARQADWVGAPIFHLLLGPLLITAAATISPGLGGVALAIGLWSWLLLRERRSAAARLLLAAGTITALAFVLAMAVTPLLHPTAPFLIQVPLIDSTLAPSGRLMIWIDAARNFAAEPFLGRGIGADSVAVRYLDPSGNLQHLSDAHNVFLSIAVQSGIVGLAALLALIGHVLWRTLPLRLPATPAGLVRLAAGLGLLNGLVYQGLGGSFEDSRHLWFALGLLLASSRIERRATTS
ncbi:MAG TPA: O-antigen ligase family protein, partial [Sphingomicrobium sp.]|nr:O-antigen ligase family protein [Sphingomicrobium sp.]